MNNDSASVSRRFLKNFKRMLRISDSDKNHSNQTDTDKTLSSLLLKDTSVTDDLANYLSSRPIDFARPSSSRTSLAKERNQRHTLQSVDSVWPKHKEDYTEVEISLKEIDVDSTPTLELEESNSWLPPTRRYPQNEYMDNPKKFVSRLVPIADQSKIWENYFHFSSESLDYQSRSSSQQTPPRSSAASFARSSSSSRRLSNMKRLSKRKPAKISRVHSESDVSNALRKKVNTSHSTSLDTSIDVSSIYSTRVRGRSQSVDVIPKQNMRVKETTLVFTSTPGPQRVTYDSGLTEFTRGKVNEFLMIREIGSGASGKVVLSQHEETGVYHACKIVDKHRMNRTNRTFALGPNASAAANRTATHPNILREIEILKRIVSHPHVNSLVEFINDTSERNIYMGTSLV